MTDHRPTRQAFRQFQYLTLPLHVHRTHIEDAWTAGHKRAAGRLKGLVP